MFYCTICTDSEPPDWSLMCVFDDEGCLQKTQTYEYLQTLNVEFIFLLM